MGIAVEEVEEEAVVKGVCFGVELKPEAREELKEEKKVRLSSLFNKCSTYTEDGVPVPEEEELETADEVEERAAAMSNAGVWLSTELTFPTGEAWNWYPDLR